MPTPQFTTDVCHLCGRDTTVIGFPASHRVKSCGCINVCRPCVEACTYAFFYRNTAIDKSKTATESCLPEQTAPVERAKLTTYQLEAITNVLCQLARTESYSLTQTRQALVDECRALNTQTGEAAGLEPRQI